MKTAIRRCLPVLFAGLCGASICSAADLDWDGVDDSVLPASGRGWRPDASVAIVDTGNYTVEKYADRLADVGYDAALIPADSGYDTLIQYEAVILPVSHAESRTYAIFAGRAADYIRYVQDGGCLYVGQPNPYDLPNQQAEITWVPYELELDAWYVIDDCPPTISDPNLCETRGIVEEVFPNPGDTVIRMGPEWVIVDRGPISLNPGVLVATYGAGHVTVELGNPSDTSFCPYSNIAFARLISCCLGENPTAIRQSTWGSLKMLYR